MPVISDNNFPNDSYGTRSERLIAIQGNFASIQGELNAPANIETWAEDCHDVFLALWGNADAEEGESKGATFTVSEKEIYMEEIYQKARTIAGMLYRDDQANYDAFKFDLPFPTSRNDKIGRVEAVLNANQKHIDKGITHLIPENIIEDLADAKSEFIEAIKNQDSERSDAHVATSELQKRYKFDTRMLQDLRSWWYTMLGKKDPRITLIGMVNPDYSGSGNNQPAAPSNFRYDYGEVAIRWSAVSGATSYQVEFSEDNTNWEVIYDGPDTEFLTNPMLAEHTYLRARARNANGFSAYTSTVNIVYDLTLPIAQNLTYLPAYPGFNWDVVPGAINYEVHLRNQSAPPDEWLRIYFGNDNTLYHADPLGSYVYRIRSWNNQGTSAWAELEYSVTP